MWGLVQSNYNSVIFKAMIEDISLYTLKKYFIKNNLPYIIANVLRL